MTSLISHAPLAETRSRLGYNVDRHERCTKHVLARDVIARMQRDMQKYSEQHRGAKRFRLRHMGAGFEAILASLQSAPTAPTAAAVSATLDEATAAAQALLEALTAGQELELRRVSNAIRLLSTMARDATPPTHTPSPSAVPGAVPSAAPSAAPGAAPSAAVFELLQIGELEGEIDFSFMVRSLLSTSAIAFHRLRSPSIALGLPLTFHELPLGFPLTFCGLPHGLPLTFRGLLLAFRDLPRPFTGPSTDFPLTPH